MVVPDVDPGPEAGYACAHEFKLVGGEGGYLGLETGDGAGSGRAAVLTIWGAIGAEGVGMASMVAERAGWTCRIAYAWEEGQAYLLRVWTEVPGWWSAAVLDISTGRDSLIGRIHVPGDWRRLANWSVMWTEYQGRPLARCQDLAAFRVVLHAPTADGGTVEPERHESRLGPGACEGSAVTDVADGVRHEVGTRT